MNESDKPLLWLHGEVKTPPFSQTARIEAGVLLCQLQTGETLGLPHSRPMPSIGYWLRLSRITHTRSRKNWRILYRIDEDAVIIIEVFHKTTQQTPLHGIETCKRRLRIYDSV